MPRGGYREKSGRKNTWASGCKFKDTKLIRVPRAIADQVLTYAHRLDEKSLDSVTKSEMMLSGAQLASRFGLNKDAVNKMRRKRIDQPLRFSEWTQEKDPQGIAWEWVTVQNAYFYKPVE